MKAISTRHYWEIWSMDRPWKSQIFTRTTQAQCMASKIVFEVTRLWLHTMTYSGKNKYESRHIIKEGSGRYKRRQQRCQVL